MEKASNILTKVLAIALVVIGALAVVGSIITAVYGTFMALQTIMSLVLLAAGVAILAFAKKDNALHLLIVLAIALVVVIVDRFATGGCAMVASIFALTGSLEIVLTIGQILSIVMIILMVVAAAAVVLKAIPMFLKK